MEKKSYVRALTFCEKLHYVPIHITPPPSPWYLYLVEGYRRVRGLAWPNDPKSYASGSISYW